MAAVDGRAIGVPLGVGSFKGGGALGLFTPRALLAALEGRGEGVLRDRPDAALCRPFISCIWPCCASMRLRFLLAEAIRADMDFLLNRRFAP